MTDGIPLAHAFVPTATRGVSDLRRRMTLLPSEIDGLVARARADVDGLGIHRSQLEALDDMMRVVLDKQRQSLAVLDPHQAPADFADRYLALSEDLAGAHELWRIFRYIIGQRQDPTLRTALDFADVVAADCYTTCLKAAHGMGLVPGDHFREPPLTYLEAELSASTASRGFGVAALTMPVRRYRDMRLPIPIVLLPFDHLSSAWLLCALHHEVGHNVDQDLGLEGDLRPRLVAALERVHVPQERWMRWRGWTSEIVADALGVLLGGAGFGHALAAMFLPMAPAARFQADDPEDPHPPLRLRVALLAALLRACEVPPLASAATALLEAAGSVRGPDEFALFVADVDVVAQATLAEPYAVLAGRSLRTLVPELSTDVTRAAALAEYLRDGIQMPDLKFPSRFPVRLVPAAAELAARGAATSEHLDEIQRRAVDVFGRIEVPTFLPGAGARREFLRGLAGGLDVGRARRTPAELPA